MLILAGSLLIRSLLGVNIDEMSITEVYISSFDILARGESF